MTPTEKIQSLVLTHHIPEWEVADALGISSQSVSAIMAGATPAPHVVGRLALIYDAMLARLGRR